MYLKKLKNIICGIAIIIAFFMLVFGSFDIPVYWRLLCAVFLGFIIGVIWLPQIYRHLNKLDDKIKIVEWVSLVLGIISILIALSPLTSIHFGKWLDNQFDKQLSYKVADFFINDQETHYIFGFDITEYKDINKSPNIANKTDLLNLYAKYCGGIIPKKERNKTMYRDFCQAKLCFDLIRFKDMDNNGKFSIYSIGDKTNLEFSGNFSNQNDIDNAIQKIKNIPYKAKETNFRDYIERLYDIVQNTTEPTNQFYKYVTFTYSDFICDRSIENIEDDLNYIRDLSEGNYNTKGFPNLNIINNLFISPCPTINNKTEFNILEYFSDASFTKTYLDKITLKEEFGKSIQNKCERDTIFFFTEKANASPTFDLSDAVYSIKIHDNNTGLDDKIILTNIKDGSIHKLSHKTFQKIMPQGKYYVKFVNSNIPSSIVLDIAKQDTHCYLTLNAEKNKHSDKIVKFMSILILTLSSIGIPYSFVKLFKK